jgi:membrane fusion protein, heavy metal efflux system
MRGQSRFVLIMTVALAVLQLCAEFGRAGGVDGQGAERRQRTRSRGGQETLVTIPADSPQLRQIRTEPVTIAEGPGDELVAPGRIALDPRRLSRVVLPLPGRIDRVMVRIGDAVRAAQPLLTIDSPEAETALTATRQAEAGVKQAAASLERARGDLDRLRDLYDHEAVARKEVLHAEQDLAQAEGALAQAEAARSQATRRLEILGLREGEPGQKIIVRAPMAGKVLDVTVTPGEYRNDTSETVMMVADLTTVLVTSDVSERDIRLVQAGEHVSVELVAYPGETFEGRVTRIADTVEPRTRTIQVQAEIANPQARLRPEMYGRIRHSHGARRLPVIPQQAIINTPAGPAVFVEHSPGVFEQVLVVTSRATGGQVAVLEGLQSSDRVVVDGAILLQGVGHKGGAR